MDYYHIRITPKSDDKGMVDRQTGPDKEELMERTS